MTIYFVVRTDVSEDSGTQRVFEAYDTREAAESYRDYLSGKVVGTLAVHEGNPVDAES